MKIIYLYFLRCLFLLALQLNCYAQDLNKLLLNATKENDLIQIKLLVEKQADINTQDENGASLLMWAVYYGDINTVKYLINQGADYKQKGLIFTNKEQTTYYGNILGVAAGENKNEILKYLIEECSINPDDREYNKETEKENGWTAIHWAAINGSDTIINTLLDNGANIDACILESHETPLILSILNRREKTAELIIRRGANINLVDTAGYNALHYIARNGMHDLIEPAISKGTYINSKTTTYGFTPLMLASYNNHLKSCHLLVSNGADLNIKTKYEKTALDYAKVKNHKLIIEYLSSPDTFEIEKYTKGDINKAFKYFNSKKYELAAQEFELANPAIEKEYGINDTSYYSKILLYTALSFQRASSYEKAELYYLRCLNIYRIKNALDDVYYGNSLNNLGLIYHNSGKYEKALPIYREALKNADKSLGKNDPDYATYLNNLANLYSDMGLYKKALALNLEATELTKRVLGEEHPDYGVRLSNLSNIYEKTGDYGKALSLLEEALILAENSLGKDNPKYWNRLTGLAHLYVELGQYEKALSIYIKKLEDIESTSGKDNIDYGNILNLAGKIYNDINHYNDACSYFIEAVENRKKYMGEDHPAYWASLNNLAACYYKIGDLPKALDLAIEAFDIEKEIFGEKDERYAASITLLSNIYSDLGQFDKSIPLSEEALVYTRKFLSNNNSSYSSALTNLASQYNDIGQYEKALALFIEANDLINNNISKKFSIVSEKEKGIILEMSKSFSNVFNSLALQNGFKEMNFTGYIYDNTLKYNGIIQRSTTNIYRNVLNSKDTLLINNYNQLLEIKEQIGYLYASGKSTSEYLQTLVEKANRIERLLVNEVQESNIFDNLSNTNWKNIRSKLKTNEVAIEFLNFKYYNKVKPTDTIFYCALTLKNDSKYPEIIPLFTSNNFERLLSNNNSEDINMIVNIYGKKRGAQILNSENNIDSLNSFIWRKIEPQLEGVNKIFYSPAGVLHNISFSALKYNDSMLLSDKYELINMASTANITTQYTQKTINNITIFGGLNYNTDTSAMLAFANKYSHHEDELLAQRNISLNDSSNVSSWSYLKGTMQEAKTISSMFDDKNIATTIISGNDGIEESFKSLSGKNSPEIIHIATHGFFFPDTTKEEPKRNSLVEYNRVFKTHNNPLMRTGLIMTGANNAWTGKPIPEGVDDGILTAYEISNMDLFNTKLVVLSACETGLGDIRGSEGVYGLQRAFKMAGVDKIIMSLWQVPDKETAEFMELFYGNLLQNQEIGDAFRAAQKVMRNKYEPYYWAAFVLVE